MNTPILFLVFNRLSETKRVFEVIKKSKPSKLYIACDGARTINKSEKKVVENIRDYLTSSIDWDCEVKTLFRNNNLGCKKAVSEAISWFFENEENGIILEDDCLPVPSFFNFCEEMLEKYKDDLRVWHISGNNFLNGRKRKNDSYYFSYYGSIWGWATWRSRWKEYSVDMKNYQELKEGKYLVDLFGNSKEADFRINNFDRISKGMDTWDFQWAYTRFINSGLSIVPTTNMIKNIGFGPTATHTFSRKDKRADMDYSDIDFPLKHPRFIIRDKVSDDLFFNETIYSLKYRIRRLLRR